MIRKKTYQPKVLSALAGAAFATSLLSLRAQSLLDFRIAQNDPNKIVFDYSKISESPAAAAPPTPKESQPALDEVLPPVEEVVENAATNLEPAPVPEMAPVSQPTPPVEPTLKPLKSAVRQSQSSVENLSIASSPTGNVTINLINKLVQRGILTKEEATDMIKQSEAEAVAVRSQSQTDMVAIAQAAAIQIAATSGPAESGLPPMSPDDVRVTHIPQPVKDQIKEEVKLELITDNVSRQIASSFRLPKWVENTKPFLDIRARYAKTSFPSNNALASSSLNFLNFNSINTGSTPYDTLGTSYPSLLNNNEDRNQYLLRARFGVDFLMGQNFSSGFRIATGSNNSPTSTNQSLGLVSSATQNQGGNFSKYAIWLDRAFMRYDFDQKNIKSTAWLGRFDNPFFYTPLVWDDDLGFDGVAANVKANLSKNFQVFATGGAFVVYNTALNISSATTGENFSSNDKYLLGIQTGIDWKIADDWKLKLAAGYYNFYNIEGKLSTPYGQTGSSDPGDTDQSRPAFAQKGNTYFPLRQVLTNTTGTQYEYQYYGLATKFQELALTARLDYNGFEPVQVSFISEFVNNVAFDKSDIQNIGANSSADIYSNNGVVNNTENGSFDGSGIGWLGEIRVGTPALTKLWDWQINAGYRWIGSDAVVDGFTDSDFGWGGTNMKGFTVGSFLALSPNVCLGVRWMGSDSIVGPKYHTNIFYFQIESKF